MCLFQCRICRYTTCWWPTRQSGVVDVVDSYLERDRQWILQKRVDGFTFYQSLGFIGLAREEEQSLELQNSREEQTSMCPCLFTTRTKEYVELPDPVLYSTPESTKPLEQERIKKKERNEERIALIEQHAQDGDPEAQLQLYYLRRDPREKLKWLCRAADQGQRHAQTALANLYWKGCGVIKQDKTRAYVSLSLAVQAGAQEYQPNLDSVIQSMSQAQLTDAERMLANWEPGQCERDLVRTDSDN